MNDDDFKLLRGFAVGQTNGQTFVIVESLSRLKIQLLVVAISIMVVNNKKILS